MALPWKMILLSLVCAYLMTTPWDAPFQTGAGLVLLGTLGVVAGADDLCGYRRRRGDFVSLLLFGPIMMLAGIALMSPLRFTALGKTILAEVSVVSIFRPSHRRR